MPLLSFSTLSPRQQPQEAEAMQRSSEKKKIKIKPVKREENKQKREKCHSEVPTTDVPTTPIRRKIRIVIKKTKQDFQKRVSYNDIVPPASMIYKPSQNNFYYTDPLPQRCCRFFIENIHCFLRESDNTCISPTSRTVIGFWNGKVGSECKLLPIQDHDEQEIVDQQMSAEFVSSSSSPTSLQPKSISNTIPLVVPAPSPSPSPSPSPRLKSQKSKPKIASIQKPRFVSDAQRARIASEPVALLREKLAKQYGIKK